MKKYIITLIILFTLIIGFTIGQLFTSLNMDDIFYSKKEYNLPNEVVIEKKSPNGVYVGQILFEKNSKSYFFAFHKTGSSKMIVDKEIISSISYHDPIFEITWDKDSQYLLINIDQDFGDGNNEYIFYCNELKLTLKE